MSTSNTKTPELQEGQLNQGIQSTRANIGVNWGLDEATLNANIGQYDGVGPRYGMQPIPNHNHSQFPASINFPVGLQATENSSYWLRSRVFGVVPLSVSSYSDTAAKVQAYFWFSQRGLMFTTDTNQYFGFSHSAAYQTFTDSASNVYNIQGINPYMDSGLSSPNTVISSPALVQNYRFWSNLFNLRKVVPRNYAKCVGFAVSGSKYPQKYMLGTVLTAGSGSTPPGQNFNRSGVPKDFYNKTVPAASQIFECQTLNTSFNTLYKRYEYSSQTLSTSYFTTLPIENISSNTQLALPVASAVTSGITTTAPTFSLFKSESMACISEFYCLAAAPGKAIMAVFQDWVRASDIDDPSFQYVDPVGILPRTPDRPTVDIYNTTSGSKYTELAVIKNTVWFHWTSYDGSISLAPDPGPVADATRSGRLWLGPANSGILRQKTTYEFTYAIFDKSTGHETNVGTPALILTGANDYTKLLFFGYTTLTANYEYISPAGYVGFPLFLSTGITNLQNDFINRINMIVYKVYFRERGTFEWIPAGEFDAPSLYDTTTREIWLCEGPFAGSVGGQPGGFNDYSPLPSDTYFDTLNYRQRLFWMSEKQLSFSRSDDVFAYPASNAVTCPKGRFKGMIAHTYPGQAEQGSRLIIFGSEEVYAARFLGANYATQQSVRVSSTAVGTFPLDGSDFKIDIWTTHTAFSSRSAVIAQGILYWWGPTGIYRDVGNELPEKGWSMNIEPLLFSIYDPNRTDEIHAVYNDVTKEIIWFYPPNPKLVKVQRALSYKIKDGAFFIWDFGNTIVDASQTVDAQFSNANARDNSGSRVMLMIRDNLNLATPQRAVFFDDMCDSGDVTCNTAFLVKQVSVSGANRRLTLATGFSATLPSTGTLTVANYQDYRDTIATNPDAIYAIAGSDGTTYIDIAPLGGSWAGFDFLIETITDTSKYFPIFTESLNGFNFNISSQYWAPFGWRFWGRWLYCYQSYKVSNLLRSGGQTVQLNFKTILGTGMSPRVITLSDNSRGNCQVHSQIVFSQQNADGQAMAITLTTPSGKFNGSRWSLQYLSYDVTEMTKNNFKSWEG